MKWVLAQEEFEKLEGDLLSWAQQTYGKGPFDEKAISERGARMAMADAEIADVLEELRRHGAEENNMKVFAKQYKILRPINLKKNDLVPGDVLEVDTHPDSRGLFRFLDYADERGGKGELVGPDINIDGMDGPSYVMEDDLIGNFKEGEDYQVINENEIKGHASIDNNLSLETLQGLAIHAMTTYKDPASQARAAFLLGACTKKFWRETASQIKKECGKEIKDGIKAMVKWGTIQPSQGAIREFVARTVQAKGIYPYPDLLLTLMESMNLIKEPGEEIETKAAEGGGFHQQVPEIGEPLDYFFYTVADNLHLPDNDDPNALPEKFPGSAVGMAAGAENKTIQDLWTLWRKNMIGDYVQNREVGYNAPGI